MKHGSLKSQTAGRKQLIAFCLGLSTNLLCDMLQQAGLDSTRDVETLRHRTSTEGLGFLTKTLPGLGKQVTSALTGNRLTITKFRKPGGTAIPHFLKGLLSLIFTVDGYVRDDADVTAVTDVTQFCALFYKLEVPYATKTESRILDKFVLTDQHLPRDFSHLGNVDNRLEPNVLQCARELVTRVLRGFNPLDISPKHGPGSVATGEEPHQKMHFKRIYDGLEEFYPFTEYFMLGDKHRFDEWDRYWSLDHVAEPQAKVVLVPKDSRGPRLISMEPLEIQYIQQGIGKKLVKWLERHPLTRGHVNFTSQEINRELALNGSSTGEWATLDLSDASDRVSTALVKELFRDTGFLPVLLATRSSSTKLPDGRVVELEKFAPMGSALCFPIEALVFWALTVACVHVYGQKSVRSILSNVYVYGDDIIVRSGYEVFALQHFHYFGLRFNQSKCCTSGSFRESCGCDAFRGEVVTPVRVKSLPPSSPKDGAKYLSFIAISNSLFYKGYYRAADYVKSSVEAVYGQVPYSGRSPHRVRFNIRVESRPELSSEAGGIVFPDSAPCWYVRQKPGRLFRRSRYNKDLQRTEYFVRTANSVLYSSKDEKDWSELFRHILGGLGTRPNLYTYLRRVQLKRKWTSLCY
jgi:hypothetical protein